MNHLAIAPAEGARSPAVTQGMEMTPVADILRQAQAIGELLQSVMKKGTHYDVIPGTKNNTLLKPGAEKILSLFRLGIRPRIDDLSNRDEIRYRITLEGFYIPTGNIVGFGIGECSSGEEKYKWRAAVCAEEYEATPPDRRREKWQSAWGQQRGERVAKCIKQVRTEPADLANTVLKMAKKRAMTDLCLSATAASDVFDQDLEELDETLRDHLVRQGGGAPEGAAGETTAPERGSKELPDYPGEQMAKNKAAWASDFASGANTPDQVIAMLTKRFTLSDVQKNTIRALHKPKPQDNTSTDNQEGGSQ